MRRIVYFGDSTSREDGSSKLCPTGSTSGHRRWVLASKEKHDELYFRLVMAKDARSTLVLMSLSS